jgi:oligoribonuclease NrnB/cAMP/cGMP phosphodiesterase (DHH superfamily)
MKYILFTHGDMDGAGCEIFFRYFFHGKSMAVSSGSIEMTNLRLRACLDQPDMTPQNTTFIFTDISCDQALLEEVVKRQFPVQVFDHHPTASWVTDVLPNAKVDLGGYESGTSIFYRHMLSASQRDYDVKPRPGTKLANELNEAIRAWDTWTWVQNRQDQRPKHMSSLFFMIGYKRFVHFYLQRLMNEQGKDCGPLILPEHMFFLEAKQEQAQEVIDNTTPAQVLSRRVFGYSAAIIFTGTGFSFSEGSYQFLRKYPEYDIMVNINMARRTVSYRTIRSDIDLGQLAQKIGGGGHAKSAGSSIGLDQIASTLETLLTGVIE